MIHKLYTHAGYCTIHSNRFAQSPELSFEARAVLRYLLSKPDTWNVCKNALKKALGVGRCVLERVTGELTQAGYLVPRNGTYVVLEDLTLAAKAAGFERGVVRLSRNERESKFSVTYNAPFEDRRLSLLARGILCYLLSMDEAWEVFIPAIAKAGKLSYARTAAAVKELEKLGFITRTAKRVGNRNCGWIFDVYEEPTGNAYFQSSEESEGRLSENKHVVRNNLTIKTELNKLPNPQTEESDETVARAAFESLVAVYPKAKRGNLDDAFGEHQSAISSGAPVPSLPDLVSLVKAACGSEQWATEGGKYIPLLKNWLRDRRWNEAMTPVLPVDSPLDDTPEEILASAEADMRRILRRRLAEGVITEVTQEAIQQAALDCIGHGWAKIRLSGYHAKAYRLWARLFPDELATTPGLKEYLEQHDPHLLASVNDYLETHDVLATV